MNLSIVIVSYNVLSFLRQCIQSVEEACSHLDYEIIIVDNDSEDGSVAFLQDLKKERIHTIVNDHNTGFGAAMNQGIEKSNGALVLLLNPDTIITKDAIDMSINKLQESLQCGAVGVRMIDGQGEYLKESKRGFPTLTSAIYKTIGLSKIFPSSARFAHYHSGHLDSNGNHKVDILTGAYLMTRKEIIERIGGFDERYFMYGEDIDLSKSISDLGYFNYYIGETSIIHFKGESTKRDTIKNTFHFYNSMLLFTKKYHPKNYLYLSLLSLVLTFLGLWRWLRLNMGPVIRSVFYVIGFYAVSYLWAKYYFGNEAYFNYSVFYGSIFTYALVLVIAFYLGNNQISKIKNLIIGLLIILVIYGLLPSFLRTSRAVLLIGSIWIVLFELGLQMWYTYKNNQGWNIFSLQRKAILLGQFDQCGDALNYLRTQDGYHYLGIIGDGPLLNKDCLTNIKYLTTFLKKNQVHTLTIHMDSIPMNLAMQTMAELGSQYQYLLYSQSDRSIISSPDRERQGQVSLIEIRWAIDTQGNRIVKRCSDIVVSILFILGLPLLIWFIKRKSNWIQNIIRSLIGKTTWVGYNQNDIEVDSLPRIKPAIISLTLDDANAHSLNVQYAREYSLLKDLSLIINSFGALGNKVQCHANHK